MNWYSPDTRVRKVRNNDCSPLSEIASATNDGVRGIRVLRKSAKNGQKTYENGHF